VFAGFAMKVSGTIVSIVGQDVSVDGSLFSGISHPVGLQVTGSPASAITVDSPDNCIHFQTNRNAHPWNPGYYHNMNVNIADTVAASDGVCGSPSGRQPLQRGDALFSSAELDSLCQICGVNNCIRRLDGRRLEMSQPDDWAPAASAEDACQLSGISYDVAAEKCQTLRDDLVYFKACIYDYCASDGDESLVSNAVESKQREVARAQVFQTSTSSRVTTTRNLREGYSYSSAQAAAPLSLLAMSVACYLFLTVTTR